MYSPKFRQVNQYFFYLESLRNGKYFQRPLSFPLGFLATTFRIQICTFYVKTLFKVVIGQKRWELVDRLCALEQNLKLVKIAVCYVICCLIYTIRLLQGRTLRLKLYYFSYLTSDGYCYLFKFLIKVCNSCVGGHSCKDPLTDICSKKLRMALWFLTNIQILILQKLLRLIDW